jgi:hypothetical protein
VSGLLEVRGQAAPSVTGFIVKRDEHDAHEIIGYSRVDPVLQCDRGAAPAPLSRDTLFVVPGVRKPPVCRPRCFVGSALRLKLREALWSAAACRRLGFALRQFEAVGFSDRFQSSNVSFADGIPVGIVDFRPDLRVAQGKTGKTSNIQCSRANLSLA